MNAFTNAVVVITGAASGIGRELALQAAGRGAAVIATDINTAALQETKNLALQRGFVISTDVLDVAEAKAIEQFALKWVPQLHPRKLILINNAGVALLSNDFRHTDLSDFEWLVRINLWGAIYMTKAFYPYLLEKNEGHLVNLSSVFGLVGIQHQSAYCTSKFALRGFTETLRMELAGTNIYTTVVHPGGVRTNIVRNSRTNEKIITKEAHENSIARFAQLAKTSSENAAKEILEAVEKRKARLVIGKDGRTLDLLARMLPVSYTSLLKRRIKLTMDKFSSL